MNRNDDKRKTVKKQILKEYGKRCMLCSQKTNKKHLELHHIIKWEDTHDTSIDNCAIVCTHCHNRLHNYEKNNIKAYNHYNQFLKLYKMYNERD